MALTACAQWEDRFAAILRSTPGVERAHWGVHAVALETGQVIATHNAAHFFTPASNTKLYTTALALRHLGPDYRYVTRVVAGKPADSRGVISGELRLVGSGDPAMAARSYPYRYEKEPSPRPPYVAALELLADRVAAAGVKRITGAIVGDDTLWAHDPFPTGWAVDDAAYDFGAPVSALTVEESAVEIRLTPGAEAGDPVTVELRPAVEYFWIDNRLRTASDASPLDLVRMPESGVVRLTGSLKAGGPVRTLRTAVDDPARFAAHLFRDALTRRGIVVDGPAIARHRTADIDAGAPEAEVELARRESPPLSDIAQIVNKDSHNLIAEMLRRTVTASADWTQLLEAIGAAKGEYDLRDGSGLSRLNLVTPELTVRLLGALRGSPAAQALEASLPVAGQDGTLDNRFRGLPGADRIRAKTGTLTHVSCLAGYADSATRGKLAFAIMVNGFNAPSKEIRDAIDRLAVELTR